MFTHPHRRRARSGRPALVLAALLALPVAGCDDPFGADAGGSAPTLALASPAAGQVIDTDSLVVEGTAADDRSVARVTFRVNGGAELAAEIVPGKQVAFRFVARGLRLGANELEVLAYDEGERVGVHRVALPPATPPRPPCRCAPPPTTSWSRATPW
ncbi:MAG: Ig-like domain-containing protein [Longimicrobiaceae bacterium]